MRLRLLLPLLFFVSTPLYGNPIQRVGDPYIQAFGSLDYESHSQIWSVVQAENGLLYAASRRDVIVFDGKNWEKLQHDLGSSLFRKLKKMPDGRIIISGFNHFGYLAYTDYGRPYYKVVSDQLPDSLRQFGEVWDISSHGNTVYIIADDDIIVWPIDGTPTFMEVPFVPYGYFPVRDRIFAYTYNRPLMELVDGEFQQSSLAGLEDHNEVRNILFYDEQNFLVVSTSKGLYLANDDNYRAFVTVEVQEKLRDAQIYAIEELSDNQGFIVATLRNGFFVLDRNGNLREHINEQSGLPNNSVKQTLLDRDGNIWAALEDGMARVEFQSPGRYLFDHHNYRNSAMAGLYHEGRIYVGGLGVVHVVEEKADTRTVYLREIMTAGTQIFTIQGHGDYLFVGTDPDINRHSLWVYHIPTETITDKLVANARNILIDEDLETGNLYVYTVERNIRKYLFEDGRLTEVDRYSLPQNFSISLYKLDDDWFLVPSISHSLHYVSRRDTLSTHISLPTISNGEQIQGLQIRRINGHLFLISVQGVFQINAEWRPGDEGTPLSDRPSFPLKMGDVEEFAQEVIQTERGDIWGMYRGRYLMIEPLTPDSDFRTKETFQIYAIPFMQRAVGTNFFSFGEHGIFNTAFDHVAFLYTNFVTQKNHIPDAPLIRSVSFIANDSLVYGGGMVRPDFMPVIQATENSIRFRFATPDFHATELLEYRFFLKGFEQDYAAWTSDTRKDYTNLPAGKYVFHVQARNYYGGVSIAGTFAFEVLPPWYFTNLALFLYLFLGIGFVYRIVQWQTQKVQEREREKARVKDIEYRAEAAELQAKIAETQAQVIEAENNRRKSELETALAVQQQFISKVIPDIPGYELAVFHDSATEIGGDYYDFKQLENKQIIFLGDATGHGLPAGIMVAMSKSATAMLDISSPKQILQKLNASLYSLKLSKLHMALMVVQCEGDHISVSSAAIPYLLHYSKRRKKTHLLELNGLPIGAIANPQYSEKSITVEPDDVLLLLTDGLLEIENQRGELLGYEPVISCLEQNSDRHPEEIKNNLLELSLNWLGENSKNDDITFIILKKKDA